MPFSFFAPEVFHHLDPYLAAVDFADILDFARVDADEFHLSCSHVCGLRRYLLAASRACDTGEAVGKVKNQRQHDFRYGCDYLACRDDQSPENMTGAP